MLENILFLIRFFDRILVSCYKEELEVLTQWGNLIINILYYKGNKLGHRNVDRYDLVW